LVSFRTFRPPLLPKPVSFFAASYSKTALTHISLIQQACYANDEMYQIMKTGSTAYMGCQDGRGEYPTGGTMGKAFCLFDTLGLVSIFFLY
jgi:hypothetical protein